MKKFLILLSLLSIVTSVFAKDVYVNPNSESGKLLANLDLTGAKNGDTPSMARVARECYLKKDMICAYKWSTMALKGKYLYQIQRAEDFKKVQKISREYLTPEQIKKIDEENKQLVQNWQKKNTNEINIGNSLGCKLGENFDKKTNSCQKSCLSNRDCNSGKEIGDFYCQVEAQRNPKYKDSDAYSNFKGICVPNGGLPKPQKISNNSIYDLGKMGWWSAKNVCSSLGKTLIDVSKLQCYYSETNRLVKSEEISFKDLNILRQARLSGGCCMKGKKCLSGEWKEGKYLNFSPLIKTLKDVYGTSKRFWTNSPYESVSSNSVYVYYIDLEYGKVDAIGRIERDDFEIDALCY